METNKQTKGNKMKYLKKLYLNEIILIALFIFSVLNLIYAQATGIVDFRIVAIDFIELAKSL